MPESSRASFHDWLQGARPHTWANAFAPVVAGTGAAAWSGSASIYRAMLAMVVAWTLIVGVNYANDYSDGIRGTDDDRQGPQRLTGSGLAKPEHVKYAAFGAFALAAVAGTLLSVMSSWWLIAVGALCILAAWFYTGGKHPYGYAGWGECAVFVFFGLVAVCGTEYTQAGRVTWVGVTCAVSIGCFSAAVNLANNLRDIPSDTDSGKRTLAVRLGDRGTRRLWLGLVAVPYLSTLVLATQCVPTLAALAALLLTRSAATPVMRGATGPALIPVLGLTGRAMLAWSVLTAAALAFSAGA